MSVGSILRRTYAGLALFCVVNTVAWLGVGVMAFTSGAVDARKFGRIMAVIRGSESSGPPPAGSATVPGEESSSTGTTEPPRAPAVGPPDLELLRRETERVQVELDQQLALVNSMMVKTAADREALRREREAAAKPPNSDLIERRENGLKKQIEIYEQLAPKTALEHLLGLDDVDQAARVLSAMEPRKAKRIVESAKTAEQSGKVRAILQRVQDVAPRRSEELRGES